MTETNELEMLEALNARQAMIIAKLTRERDAAQADAKWAWDEAVNARVECMRLRAKLREERHP